jgi:hypothetical protein
MHMRNILTAAGLAALLVVPMTAASQANGKGNTQAFPPRFRRLPGWKRRISRSTR